MELFGKLVGKNRRVITEKLLEGFRQYLVGEEKAKNTVEKYVRDVKKLMDYAAGRKITKELVVAYKGDLQGKGYKISSINSFLAAANCFFRYTGWKGLEVRALVAQRETYRPEARELTEEDYRSLLDAALELGRQRIYMIIMTLCAAGLRVSELAAVTVEAVMSGKILVTNKGKSRIVPVPEGLGRKLMDYAAGLGITEGVLFRTRSGACVGRGCIWREMKDLCVKAGVDAGKVFPHNLRHLFARTYYGKWQDIAKLADIMGHSSVDTTRLYIRESEEECRRRMEGTGLAA